MKFLNLQTANCVLVLVKSLVFLVITVLRASMQEEMGDSQIAIEEEEEAPVVENPPVVKNPIPVVENECTCCSSLLREIKEELRNLREEIREENEKRKKEEKKCTIIWVAAGLYSFISGLVSMVLAILNRFKPV